MLVHNDPTHIPLTGRCGAKRKIDRSNANPQTLNGVYYPDVDCCNVQNHLCVNCKEQLTNQEKTHMCNNEEVFGPEDVLGLPDYNGDYHVHGVGENVAEQQPTPQRPVEDEGPCEFTEEDILPLPTYPTRD